MAKSKNIKAFIKLQIVGGGATPAANIGSALGSKGVSIMDFCKQFNACTQDRKGELLRVFITVYNDNKPFSFVVKSPSVMNLLMKKADIKKGSSEPNMNKVGKVSWDDIAQIAGLKVSELNSNCLNSAMKMILGTAKSIGLSVDGKAPWDN